MFLWRPIQHGSADQSVIIRIIDSTDGTPETGVTSATGGLDLEYVRDRSTVTNLTETDLAAVDSAHSDGGMIHLGNGYYRIDVPDAAFASGVSGVLISGTATGMVVIACYVPLVPFNPYADVIGTPAGASLSADIATVDTVVDAIKAKTDSLAFTVTGEVDANTKSMNDTTVQGTGTDGDKWRGA
jgi:hypothetical protein